MFNNIYYKKKILITGHTGFKGSWLTTWLLHLGANIIGVAKDVPSTPSLFEVLKLKNKIKNIKLNISKNDQIIKIIKKEKPDYIFHLAAQSIVSKSYENPIETIESNVMGTSNILEALRQSNHNCKAVLITSDKVYENYEQVWGYRENDKKGGKDIYSGSKSAADIIINSYFNSFIKDNKSNIRLAVGRAGNVIGGGDWAKDRVVVDAVTSWNLQKSVNIRNPNSTRPWQHVLEPISGYLTLGKLLSLDKKINGQSFNFGPKSEQNKSVKSLLMDISLNWNDKKKFTFFNFVKNKKKFKEAGLLKLNCDKALSLLNWQPVLKYEDMIKFTANWYYSFYRSKINMMELTLEQINRYHELSISNNQ